MDIVVVSAEVAPYLRATAVSETCAALPKALRGLGHKVTVLSPLWASIDPGARHLARRLFKVELTIDGAAHSLGLYEGRSAGGVDLQFFANETLFPRNASPLDEGVETALRWGAFARAALELIKRREAPPDIIHVIGWQTAVLPALLREDPTLAAVPTVLTMYDTDGRGLYDRNALSTFGLSPSWWRIDGAEFFGKLSTLKAGIQTASRVTTPSPTYAREIVEKKSGLEGAFQARGRALSGILDGVDVSVWNAATDPWLESRFDPMDVAGRGKYGKHRCKTALQKELALPVRDDVPLIACTGTAVAGSGFDDLVKIAGSLLRNDLQLVIATEPGSDPALVGRLVDLTTRWPDRIAVRADADVGMVHRLHGAADLMLITAPADPSGVRAMQAHRYGALPIAHRTGGHVDAIVDCDARLTSGTGFLFDPAENEADSFGARMLGGIQRAVASYGQREMFRGAQHRAMTVDHSWERSARLYERLYRATTASNARPEDKPEARA